MDRKAIIINCPNIMQKATQSICQGTDVLFKTSNVTSKSEIVISRIYTLSYPHRSPACQSVPSKGDWSDSVAVVDRIRFQAANIMEDIRQT